MRSERPRLAAHRALPNMHGIGSKLGPRIAKLVTDAQEHTLWKTRAVRAGIGADAANVFFHGINRELRDTLGQHMWTLARDENMPEELRALFEFVARQPGEGAALLGMAWYGTGMSTTIGSMLGDLLAPVIQNYLAGHPNAIIPVDGVVNLAARGIVGEAWAALESAKAAVNVDRFNLLLQGAQTYLDAGSALELLRRNVIDEGEAAFAFKRQGYRDVDIQRMLYLRRVELSPADLADMVVRGIKDEPDAAAIAERSGINPDDFSLMVRDTGEPPAMMQLLEAYRRKFVDRDRLVHGIRQGRIKDEWIDVIEKLRYSPMDISDAARAVVQNYMSLEEATGLAQENGLDPDYMHFIVEIQGEPLAHGQMLELYNRGEVTLADVKQSMRESHLKDKYIDTAIKLRRRLMPERQLVMAVEHGALDTKQATTRLLELGYTETDARILISTGHNANIGREKELARSDIVTLYVDYAIEHADAIGMLEAIGYNHENALLVMEIAEFRRTASDINKVVTALHKLYMERWLDDDELRADMSKLGVPVQRIEHLLALWRLERDSVRPHPTATEVAKATKKGALTEAQGIGRLEQMGYTTSDAMIILVAA